MVSTGFVMCGVNVAQKKDEDEKKGRSNSQ